VVRLYDELDTPMSSRQQQLARACISDERARALIVETLPPVVSALMTPACRS
jgi:hypothetical protein